MRWWGPLLMLALLALPLARGESVHGQIELVGAPQFPPNTIVRSNDPLALFARAEAPDAEAATTASFTSARVLLFEDRYVRGEVLDQRPIVTTDTHRPFWAVQNMSVEITWSRPGWMGLHGAAGHLAETAAAELVLPLEPQAAIGNGRANPDEGDPAQPFYLVRTMRPTFVRTTPDWIFDGDGLLKVMGPTLTLRSPVNTTTYATGEMPDPDNPGQTLRRWLAFEFHAGHIASHDIPTTTATHEASVAWDGLAQVNAAEASVQGTQREWTAATPGRYGIAGNLTASLAPADGAGGRVLMLIQGDLRASTFSARLATPDHAADASWIVALALVAIAVAGGAGGAYHLQQRRRRRATASSPPLLDAADYARLADDAADSDDYERAAHLAAVARRQSPTSKRIAIEHAFYVAQAGNPEAALLLLDDPLIKDDADALLLRARLHRERGEDGEAASAIARALHNAPIILLDVETMPTLAPLLAHPLARDAVRAARRRLG